MRPSCSPLRLRNLLLPSVLAFVVSGSWPVGADWPGLRGPHFDGSARDVVLFEGESASLAPVWKRELGPGYSALAIGDGRVIALFAAAEGDFAAAFDTETGEEIWRYRIADTYAGHDGSHDGPISTPALAAGRVFGLGPRGQLFALDASSGAELWSTHLVDDHGSKKPHYGFATSPLVVDEVLVVEIGAGEGKSVAGFDVRDGNLLWTAGDDPIEYHSPIVADVGGKKQVLAAGGKTLYGIDPSTGAVLWSYEHDGDQRAMGGATIVPVPAGDGRIFLMNKIDSSVMLRVERRKKQYDVTELWSNNAIRSSYVIPVYHEGFLYGMNSRIFTSVDATTGEIAWRSREPGDGFPTLVGNRLVIMTKPGTLHVADASSAGYVERARLDLFDEHSWSTVAFADGTLYARSMARLARIDVQAGPVVAQDAGWISRTEFGRFLAEMERSADKQALVDAYLARQRTFPIVEPSGAVHFVYRGDATDVGIVGDMIGFRREDPMRRVDGTDLFYYSTWLEPDAAVTYGFIPSFGEPVADPLNSRPGEGLFGEVSWFAMPAWEAPEYMDQVEPSRRGRIEELEWDSQVRVDEKRAARVYLPAGYDQDGNRRYPVLYVHGGRSALEDGLMHQALDHLIGERIEPVIAVFVLEDEENARRDLGQHETYAEMIVTELVPKIDAQYRTVPEALARATVGSGSGANVALYSAFKYPDTFGRLGAQSATMGADEIAELADPATTRPLVIYHEWGRYHLRSPHEAWDLAEENRKVRRVLRERGYRPAGGEIPEGYGWACWRGHVDDMLTALFPSRGDRSGGV